MSAPKNNGGPAFPFRDEYCDGSFDQFTGMTLRDYFAGQALCGFISASGKRDVLAKLDAGMCYLMADAMIKARNQEASK